jgi:asparagine synthase (glutamine-hydrolysing)
VHEFPPGHYMDRNGKLTPFGTLSDISTEIRHTDEHEVQQEIREIIQRSVQHRVNFTEPTACLLSGGMDSSVIGYFASRLYKQKFGDEARLPTFAIGVGESHDIQHARIMAEHIDADHNELIITRNQMLEVLPEVIYYLESFDPSLVRSAASNFLISRYAKQHGIEVLLSGEGGDEVFCGYTYLKDLPSEELPEQQLKCLSYLHNNAVLRLDRMNQCHSIQVVAPLISGELLKYSMNIPPKYKVKPEGDQKIEKWIFRKAFEKELPEAIIWRTKQEFSQGSGSADFLPSYFEDVISDAEFAEAQTAFPMIRSKEELYYFRLFAQHFGTDQAIGTVGQWVSL